jgi:CTP:molybdopterin cytidylyltransferase MocA
MVMVFVLKRNCATARLPDAVATPSCDIMPLSRLRIACALAAALIALSLASAISQSDAPAILPYVLAIAIGSALVSIVLWKAEAVGPKTIVAGAILLHLVAIIGVPAFEDDHFRFIWDGWQIAAFGTPYGTPPSDFFGDAQVPAALQSILDGVNNPDVPTIYGPALELLFAAAYALFGTELLGLRLIFAGINLLLIALMLRHHAPERVALYAWNPLAVSEIALHVHPDGVMAAALFAGVMLLKSRPWLAALLFALAAGGKLVALAAWPLLLRARPVALVVAVVTLVLLYLIFLGQGAGAGFESTAIFASQWHFNPLAYELLLMLLPSDPARLAAAAIAGLAVLWFHARAEGRIEASLTAIFGVILLFAPAVNAWYLLWLLPFAVRGRQIWPFAATVALPFSYLTGLNLADESLRPFEVHSVAWIAEVAILIAATAWDIYSARKTRRAAQALLPIGQPSTAIIIPALNEEASVGGVVKGLRDAKIAGLGPIIVVDNGSTDRTAEVATLAGAIVIRQPERGYGAACLAGMAGLPAATNIVLFADADGSDVPEDAVRLVEAVVRGDAAMVIGSRMLGKVEPGAMTWPQRFGNWLAPGLVRLIWGVRYTDLGPLRAIRRATLDVLAMEDRNFGWTVEMQVRAAKFGIRTAELPVGYRKRIGVSKISGTLSGVLGAGTKILYIIAREAFGDFGKSNRVAVEPKRDQLCGGRGISCSTG